MSKLTEDDLSIIEILTKFTIELEKNQDDDLKTQEEVLFNDNIVFTEAYINTLGESVGLYHFIDEEFPTFSSMNGSLEDSIEGLKKDFKFSIEILVFVESIIWSCSPFLFFQLLKSSIYFFICTTCFLDKTFVILLFLLDFLLIHLLNIESEFFLEDSYNNADNGIPNR